MRLRKLFYGLLALFALLVLGVVVILATIDPNDYRDEIRAQVKQHTGRELTIDGDLNLSVFPWVGLEIGALQLGNAPGFDDQPFAAMDGAQIRVQLLPLLKSEVRVDVIRLEGVELALQRNAKGVSNWDDLAGSGSAQPEAEAAAGPGDEADSPPLAALAIGGVQIADSRLSLRDAQAGSDLVIDRLNLDIGTIELGKAFPMSLSFRFVSDSSGLAADIALGGDVTVAESLQQFAVADFTLAVTAAGASIPGGEQKVSLAASRVAADLATQTAQIHNLSGDAAGVPLKGQVSVRDLQTAPLASGNLALGSFSARELLERLGIALETADANALKNVELAMQFEAGTSAAELQDLRITLDQSTLAGSLALTDYAAPGLRFDLQLDDIDVDRYLPPKAEQAEAPPADPAANPDDAPIALPVEFLRGLLLDGRFRAGKVIASGLTVTQIDLPVKASGGVIDIPALTAQLYEGALKQSAQVDVRKDTPRFAAQTALNGVQAGPLLKDLMDDDPLQGKGQVQAKISTAGGTVGALKKALDGSLALDFRDGAVKGINIGYELRRAQAKLTGKDFSEQDTTKATDFASLRVSALIDKGVLRSDDLDMRSPLLRAGGVGTVDLPQSYVDYKARILLAGTAEGQGGKARSDLSGLKISVPIRGKFDDLSADFVGAVLDAAKDDAKARLKQTEEEAKAKLREQEEAAKAKLKAEEDAAKAKLKAREEEEKAKLKAREEVEKRKLEQQVKDKLKGLLN